MAESDRPIACTLTDSDLQERRSGLLRVVGQSVLERSEREAGFAYRFPVTMFKQVAEVIELERQCCAFLRFTLTVEAGGRSLWLEIDGPSEARLFIATLWD